MLILIDYQIWINKIAIVNIKKLLTIKHSHVFKKTYRNIVQ